MDASLPFLLQRYPFLWKISLMNLTNISFFWQHFCSVWKNIWFTAVWIGKWQGRLSGGWSVWATAKSPWKYQERPPNIFVCHEIWWTSNPPFWWEKFWCPKILHQDLIYQKLMRFQYQPNQGIWQNQNQINSCWFWFDTKLQRESLQIYTVDGESFHVVTISREEFSNAQNHS